MQGGEDPQRLADAYAVGKRGILQLCADPPAQSIARPGRVEAEHRDRTGVCSAQPLEDLDGGGLARAVRAEQPEQLALLDRERDAVQYLRRAVPLLQVAHFDRRGGWSSDEARKVRCERWRT